jgi:ferredoxin
LRAPAKASLMGRSNTIRIGADTAVCAGSGLCSHIAAKYFDSADGVVKILREEVDGEDDEAVAEAISACPTQALRLERSSRSS